MTGVGDPPLGDPVTPGVHTMTTGTGPDSATLDPILVTTDIGAIANTNTAGTIPDPSIDLPIAAPHITGAPVHTTTAETLPTADLLLLAMISPEMTADLDIAPDNANTDQPEDHQQQHRHHPENMKTRNRNINKSPLMIHLPNITAQTKVKVTPRMN